MILSRANNYIRALRLPFITASILPFIFGSLLSLNGFSWLNFSLGLVSVIFTHLGANLINDYADSKSRADWQDKSFYKFFGGSKLIQEGIFSEKFYLLAGLLCFSIAIVCILILAFLFSSLLILGFYFLILFLGFSYSHKPLQLSYNMLGEMTIFILFGPALVMGGYFIQTQIFPALKSFLLSLPFGFFTAAILFANEVPDYLDDLRVKKKTLVNLTGWKESFIFYLILMGLGLVFIFLGIILGYLNLLAFCSLLLSIPIIKAAKILQIYYSDKAKLIESSKITIGIHTVVSILLILSLVL
ncbi:MAG: prenyltransferase [Candidatus Omnitrophica bacterium]|jgi:1,4-dihydroxy-2-naphthoate octaprenyltransferase|nr:prenyltransferase [Candidatus Omnitrophota bacterium]